MKIVAIIQARMGSTRLPGKVMMDLAGEPMLVRVINRTKRAKTIDEVVVATTIKPDDDGIVDLCVERGWAYFRGSEEDVLDRYYNAAIEYDANVVVRITSDCPLIEPSVIDLVVNKFLHNQPEVGYCSNSLKRSFPRGLDVEVIDFDALKYAWREDNDPRLREHVTQYIIRHPEVFHQRNVSNSVDLSYLRWTVDAAEDLAFVRKIYEHFIYDHFTWIEVLELLKKNPDWLDINRHIRQKLV